MCVCVCVCVFCVHTCMRACVCLHILHIVVFEPVLMCTLCVSCLLNYNSVYVDVHYLCSAAGRCFRKSLIIFKYVYLCAISGGVYKL